MPENRDGWEEFGRALGEALANARPKESREYSDEEFQFLKACEAYRQRRGRKFMEACDYLVVLKALGYHR